MWNGRWGSYCVYGRITCGVMVLKALCRLSECGVYCKVVLQMVPDFPCVGWRIEGASLSCD